MHKVITLGITLVLLLSGCGQSQADQACEAYRSGDRQATIKAFSKLYRENPAYKELAESATTIDNYYKLNAQYQREFEEAQRSAKELKLARERGEYSGSIYSPLEPKKIDQRYLDEATSAIDQFCS